MKQVPKLLAASAAVIGLVYLLICGLLFLSQRAYIYYPTGRSGSAPAFTLHRGDADVVVSTNNTRSDRAVLYFGGNAEDVSQSIAPLSRAFPGAAVYAIHYRSYGGSTGIPSEHSLVADGMNLFNLVSKGHVQISVVGRSLGSGIAVQIAAAKPIERLVLITPYNSIAELAAERFKLFPTGIILQNKYESWRYVHQVHVPTTIIIAGNDEVIPNESSQKLADAFQPGVVNVVNIPNAGHNDVSDSPAYFAALSGGHVHEN